MSSRRKGHRLLEAYIPKKCMICNIKYVPNRRKRMFPSQTCSPKCSKLYTNINRNLDQIQRKKLYKIKKLVFEINQILNLKGGKNGDM